MPTGAREVGREADREQRGGRNDQPARGGIAAGAEGRRAHDERREQAEGGEAGPRDGVVVQRERGEHESGSRPAGPCGGREPAVPPVPRGRRPTIVPAAPFSTAITWTKPKSATASAIAARTALARRAITRVGPSRSMGARSAVCVLMARSSQATQRSIGPRPDAPWGRAVSADRMTEPGGRPRFRRSAPTALTYGAGERSAASQSKPSVAWRTSSQRDRLQRERPREHDRRAHECAARRLRAAHRRARARRGRTRAPSSRRRRAATRGRRAPSPAGAARGRGSARAGRAAHRSARARPAGPRPARRPPARAASASPQHHGRGLAR